MFLQKNSKTTYHWKSSKNFKKNDLDLTFSYLQTDAQNGRKFMNRFIHKMYELLFYIRIAYSNANLSANANLGAALL